MSGTNSFYNQIGYELIHVKEIDSTNTYLLNNHNSFNSKTILWADEQTKGRGRFNREWKSQNDLLFSILYKDLRNSFSITIPLAIVYALAFFDIDASIKWPNDIYIGNNKLCGILIENIVSEDDLVTIVGIGINYQNKPEVNGIGLSKFKNIKKELLLIKILEYVERLINLPIAFVLDAYRAHNMVLNRNVVYQNKEYKVCDVAEDGSLILLNNQDYIKVTSDEINILSALKKAN